MLRRSVLPTTVPGMNDRHARHRATPSDPRRRPVDGFRMSSGERFTEVVESALQGLPEPLASAVGALDVAVAEVPPETASNATLLVRYDTGPQSSAGRARLEVFRRPLEARARGTADLMMLIREATVLELAAALGIDQDRLDELGW